MSLISYGKSLEDLVKIASSGASFEMSPAGRSTEDLIKIVAAAKASDSIVYIIDLSGKTTDDLVKIGNAGRGGHVVFVEDKRIKKEDTGNMIN